MTQSEKVKPKLKKIDIQILEVPAEAYRHDVMALRIALSPLTNGQVESPNPAEVIHALQEVIKRRHVVLRSLRHGKWERLDYLSYWYAVNCPPPLVSSKPRGLRLCQKSRICPFCWCRNYVLRPFYRINTWLFNADGGLNWDVELCEVYLSCAFPRIRTEPAEIMGMLPELKQKLRSAVPFSYGSHVLFSLAATKNSWVLRANGVFAIPPGMALPADFEEDLPRGRWSQHAMRQTLPHGTGSLASTMGRVSAYPASLLRGSREDTLRILQATYSHCRMSEFYGSFRNKVQSEASD